MAQDVAHSSIFRTSDFIVLLALVCGAVIEYVLFWDWSLPLSTPRRVFVGAIVARMGVALIFASRIALREANQPSKPGKPATQIVTSGVFRYTRNPTYLGLGILMLGIGVAANYIAWIALSILAVVAMHYVLVIREEEYLVSEFPNEYLCYKSRVRRWI